MLRSVAIERYVTSKYRRHSRICGFLEYTLGFSAWTGGGVDGTEGGVGRAGLGTFGTEGMDRGVVGEGSLGSEGTGGGVTCVVHRHSNPRPRKVNGV